MATLSGQIPFVERVRQIREERQIGLMDASKIAQREKLLELVDQAETIEDLKCILRQIIRNPQEGE